MGKMSMQPILPVTLSVKKIEGATRQCYSDGVDSCKQTLRSWDLTTFILLLLFSLHEFTFDLYT